MLTKSTVLCAATKLQRAKENGDHDPVSGYTVAEIMDFLQEIADGAHDLNDLWDLRGQAERVLKEARS